MPLVLRNEQSSIPVAAHWESLLRRLTAHVLAAEGLPADAEVSLTLVDDRRIRQLNRDYRGKDAPTDVLSFPQLEPAEIEALRTAVGTGGTQPAGQGLPGQGPPGEGHPGPSGGKNGANPGGEEAGVPEPAGEPELLLGDVVISLERAAAQAETYGHSLDRELAFLYVHGLLHLLGYDHPDPEAERIMQGKTESALAAFGLKRS
ncbi:MAG TPA: rRNA maturation RNase YbeY [Thermaerobacter sp.]